MSRCNSNQSQEEEDRLRIIRRPNDVRNKAPPSPYCDFCLGDARENRKTNVSRVSDRRLNGISFARQIACIVSNEKLVRHSRFQRIWSRARIVDVLVIQHAFNLRRTWSSLLKDTDGNVLSVNIARFVAHRTMTISCCFATTVTEGKYRAFCCLNSISFDTCFVCGAIWLIYIFLSTILVITCIVCHRHWTHHQKAYGVVIFVRKSSTLENEFILYKNVMTEHRQPNTADNHIHTQYTLHT